MSGKILAAKFLVVVFFLLSSLQKFNDSAMYEQMLIGGYNNFFSKISSITGVYLPLSPTFIELNSRFIILLAAVLQVIGSVLVLVGNKYGSYLLALILLSYNVVIHNPALLSAPEERETNTMQLLLNFGWMAALFLVSGVEEEIAKVKTS
ncbi:unnamed protein product [Blepharisma stoltei]|uniref:DoxX family protein n=1 Tax=Blepharisma stoltei TaxID=1481888 RepID=A0AAU9J733_9CILI|nr:unnamed protein product [Blepharisma stoltei]